MQVERPRVLKGAEICRDAEPTPVLKAAVTGRHVGVAAEVATPDVTDILLIPEVRADR